MAPARHSYHFQWTWRSCDAWNHWTCQTMRSQCYRTTLKTWATLSCWTSVQTRYISSTPHRHAHFVADSWCHQQHMTGFTSSFSSSIGSILSSPPTSTWLNSWGTLSEELHLNLLNSITELLLKILPFAQTSNSWTSVTTRLTSFPTFVNVLRKNCAVWGTDVV